MSNNPIFFFLPFQTGGGIYDKKHDVEEIVNTEESETDSSSSSISIDFINNTLNSQKEDDDKVTSKSQDSSEGTSKRRDTTSLSTEPPPKKVRTFNFQVIEWKMEACQLEPNLVPVQSIIKDYFADDIYKARYTSSDYHSFPTIHAIEVDPSTVFLGSKIV